MAQIPDSLANRLSTSEAEALRRFLDMCGTTLPAVYREAILDHQESRGDDAQLFGLKVYKHERFSLLQATMEDDEIAFIEDDGAYLVAIGPLRVRIDSLGHFAHEDVLGCFPDVSRAKKRVGQVNAQQMRLSMPEAEPVPTALAYALNGLTVGHFGNSREGLVKWYIGAWVEGTLGPEWAWITRQDEAGEELPAEGISETIAPFDQRVADSVSVSPRRSA